MKKTKKILSVLLLLAMLCSLLGVTALNASADTKDNNTTQASAVQVSVPTVTKHRVTEGTTMPAEIYTFNIAPADTLDSKDIPVFGHTPVIGPTPSNVTNNTISFLAGSASDDGTCSPKFSANFGDDPGIFKYQLTEQAGSVNGETYDTTVYYVYVYYGYATDSASAPSVLAVYAYEKGTNYTLGQAHGTSGNAANNKVNPEFTNTFGTTELKINKKVSGNFGDKTKEFTFNITFTFSTTEYGAGINGRVTLNGTVLDESKNFRSGVAASYNLKHNDSLTISGIPAGVSYSITETGANANGYITTASVVSGNATVGTGARCSGTIVSGNQEVTYTNRNNIAPTGVFLEYAPYLAVMIAVFCFSVIYCVFTKKQRNRKEVRTKE